MLSAKPSDLKYLNWMTNIAHDKDIDSLEYLTLNHDTVLEQALACNSVAFCDGFGEPVNGVRFWQPNRLQAAHRVRLSKLHGSVDWFRYRSNKNVGIALERDAFQTDPRPELLVGTFNKIVEYTTGVFADLHCHFHQCLRQTRLMVCCGYGFGDKGVPRHYPLSTTPLNPPEVVVCALRLFEQESKRSKVENRKSRGLKSIETLQIFPIEPDPSIFHPGSCVVLPPKPLSGLPQKDPRIVRRQTIYQPGDLWLQHYVTPMAKSMRCIAVKR
jgi:hypothetical protein